MTNEGMIREKEPPIITAMQNNISNVGYIRVKIGDTNDPVIVRHLFGCRHLGKFSVLVGNEVKEYSMGDITIDPNSSEPRDSKETFTERFLPTDYTIQSAFPSETDKLTVCLHESLIAAANRFMQIKDTIPRENDESTVYTNWMTTEGRITLTWLSEHGRNAFAVYTVVIKEELRQRGIFTRFLLTMADHPGINRIYILAVGNPYLDAFLGKFQIHGTGFTCHGGDWLWFKPTQV